MKFRTCRAWSATLAGLPGDREATATGADVHAPATPVAACRCGSRRSAGWQLSRDNDRRALRYS
ncbi:MAG: hypothetical protein MRJ68_08255 [Nitrospira sp.]|nr:hypothetical protein [Nitrospira sp.]